MNNSILIIALLSVLGCGHRPVIHAQTKELIETVYASGKLVPERESSLASETNGAIVQKLVKDGDVVRKGQLLYLLKSEDISRKVDAAAESYRIAGTNLSAESPLLTDLRLALENAKVKLTNDSLTYERWKALWAQNIGTRNNLDNVHSQYQLSQNGERSAEQKYLSALNDLRLSRTNAGSQLTSARKELDDRCVRSDRDGVVYQTFKEAGESVRQNETVVLIGEKGPPLLWLSVDQLDIEKIRCGQQVLLQIDATGETIYQAAVSRIYPVMNETDQTFRVEARFTGAIPPAFIHSSVEANIIVQRKCNVLVVPRACLAGKDSIWIYDRGKPVKTAVRTGISTMDLDRWWPRGIRSSSSPMTRMWRIVRIASFVWRMDGSMVSLAVRYEQGHGVVPDKPIDKTVMEKARPVAAAEGAGDQPGLLQHTEPGIIEEVRAHVEAERPEMFEMLLAPFADQRFVGDAGLLVVADAYQCRTKPVEFGEQVGELTNSVNGGSGTVVRKDDLAGQRRFFGEQQHGTFGMIQYLLHVGVGLPVVDGFEEMAAAQEQEVGETRFTAECGKCKIISILMHPAGDAMLFAIAFHPCPMVGDNFVCILRGVDIPGLFYPTRCGP